MRIFSASTTGKYIIQITDCTSFLVSLEEMRSLRDALDNIIDPSEENYK